MLVRALSGLLQPTVTPTGIPEGYTLQWSDEFPGEALDTEKWGVPPASTPHVEVSGGTLTLHLVGAEGPPATQEGGYIISSDASPFSVDTRIYKQRRFFSPGYMEVRARTSNVRGVVSEVVMFTDWLERPAPLSTNWYLAEIDIVERLGYDERPLLSTHQRLWPADFGGTIDNKVDNIFHAVPDPEDFHTFAVWWTDDFVRQYVDGQLVKERDESDDFFTDLFRHPSGHNLYLGIYIATSGFGNEEGVDWAALPSQMEIDYVRFYAPTELPAPPALPPAPYNILLPMDRTFTIGKRESGADVFVPTLYDRSGRISWMRQSTEAAQPKLIDGALVFDGTDDFIADELVNNWIGDAAGYTTGVRFIVDSFASDLSPIVCERDFSTWGLFQRVTSPQLVAWQYDADTERRVEGAISSGVEVTAVLRHTGTALELWINGTLASSVATTAGQQFGQFNQVTLGGNPEMPAFSAVQILRIASYKVALSDGNRAALEAWLAGGA